MERTSLDDAVDQGEDDMSRPFSELRAEMSPEAQQRAKERTEDMLTAMTCVYCGKPVEGLREGAYIAAHTECFNKTAAAVGDGEIKHD